MPSARHVAVVIAVLVAVGAARTAHAAPPNRVYGTVTLHGAPAPVGTTIVALTGGKVCGTTTVTATAVSGSSYPYVLNLPDPAAPLECKPGAVITFTVAGLPAGQRITLDDLGTFLRVDLIAPGIPAVPRRTPSRCRPGAPTSCLPFPMALQRRQWPRRWYRQRRCTRSGATTRPPGGTPASARQRRSPAI